MERVNFWTTIRCSSGIHANHRVKVTAVYDTDDDGAYMWVESVLLVPWPSHDPDGGRYRWASLPSGREVKDKLGILEFQALIWEAQEQYQRNKRAESRLTDLEGGGRHAG